MLKSNLGGETGENETEPNHPDVDINEIHLMSHMFATRVFVFYWGGGAVPGGWMS